MSLCNCKRLESKSNWDQDSTQRKALSALCAENKIDPSCYTFVIKTQIIVIIYVVSHLLKCTQNALLRCKKLDLQKIK